MFTSHSKCVSIKHLYVLHKGPISSQNCFHDEHKNLVFPSPDIGVEIQDFPEIISVYFFSSFVSSIIGDVFFQIVNVSLINFDLNV